MVVTTLCLWLIAALNVTAIADLPRDMHVRTVVLQGPETEAIEQAPQDQPEAEPVPREPEIMTVDLDMPDIEPLEPDPLDLRLDLPSPDVNPIRVTVRNSPPEPAAPRPRRPPQPAKKAAARPTAHAANRVDEPPREYAGNVPPRYPPREERLGIEGSVRVRLLIDETGRVVDLQFISGPQVFRDAVSDAVTQWRFSPARHLGQPVKVWGVKEIQFRSRRGR
jgi:protein TonB